MISAAMMLPTIAPMAVPLSLDEPDVDVGPARMELEVVEDWVDEPIVDDSAGVPDNDSVGVTDNDSAGVTDNEED